MGTLSAVRARLPDRLFIAITLDLPLVTWIAGFSITVPDFLARKKKPINLTIREALRRRMGLRP
jgi:hypothetical protein